MNLHPRYFKVVEAENRMSEACIKVADEYDLTPGELAHWHANQAATYAKYVIRMERHGNYGTKGDEAPEDDDGRG